MLELLIVLKKRNNTYQYQEVEWILDYIERMINNEYTIIAIYYKLLNILKQREMQNEKWIIDYIEYKLEEIFEF